MSTVTIRSQQQTASAGDPVRQAARQVFARRLKEVQQRLADVEAEESEVAPGDADIGQVDSVDEEEALRRCMVKYWPKVCQSRATEQDLSLYFQYLLALERRLNDAADLRFLDAWNQAYETLVADQLVEAMPMYREFLRRYAAAIKKLISPTYIPRSHAPRGNASRTLCVPDAWLESPQRGRRASMLAFPRGAWERGGNPTLKVLLLCSSPVKARQLLRDLAGVEGIECQALVCRNGTDSVPMFLLKQAARTVLAGPRAVWDSLRMWASGELQIRLQPLGDERVLSWLRAKQFDVGLHAMGVIYRRPMIDAFRLGILNAHIGLLPQYRGRSVMEWSLLEGAPAGITTFFIDEGIDTGNPVVVRREASLAGCTTLTEAKRRLFSLDGANYAEALRRILADDYQPQGQDIQQGRRYYVMSCLLEEVAAAAFAEQLPSVE